MTENGRAMPDSGRSGLVFNVAAAVLAVVCVASLASVLLVKVAGGRPWIALDWIAMIGLPLAFVLMGIGVLRAIARRRRL
ncbi:hypothetical protein [Paenarthrobacter sp. PH39-S1]|uniref:hypothetical protein n=1 Tax=Paenarthrobacter sp. PH39-S1 TaxID=3046204 RepID=UPI0024B8C3C0|nr:hypothetical protein [Paenarthrobacter sp. PH39-S1]MDJ0354601.1 hypothetical protein [Paenarthrobacter sp. PH39-S1]